MPPPPLQTKPWAPPVVAAARVQLSSATPLSEAIKDCQRLCDAEVFTKLMPRLIELLKTGVGVCPCAAAGRGPRGRWCAGGEGRARGAADMGRATRCRWGLFSFWSITDLILSPGPRHGAGGAVKKAHGPRPVIPYKS